MLHFVAMLTLSVECNVKSYALAQILILHNVWYVKENFKENSFDVYDITVNSIKYNM